MRRVFQRGLSLSKPSGTALVTTETTTTTATAAAATTTTVTESKDGKDDGSITDTLASLHFMSGEVDLESAKRIFEHFDLDGNGTLDGSEITKFLKKYCEVNKITTDEHHMDNLKEDFMNTFDLNNDGTISWLDFHATASEKKELMKKYQLAREQKHANITTQLLSNNRQWAEACKQRPGFLESMQEGQSPEIFWIGCCDSRVPETEITGSHSGMIFVHRNVANLVVQTDLNMLCALCYAVEHLKVTHVIVCGHYNCGGVGAAFSNKDYGENINPWLGQIKEVYSKHRVELDKLDEKKKYARLVELNVVEQCNNLAKTRVIQAAWKKQRVQISGWVYNFGTGLITNLDNDIDGIQDMEKVFKYTKFGH